MFMVAAAATPIEEIGSNFSKIIGYVGQFLTQITTGSLASLLPLLTLGIAISLVMVCVKIIRKVTWGA